MAQANAPSSCLSDEENELLFTLVGSRKQSKASAVVQMFHAQVDKYQWTKFKTGVVCFVKDNPKKSYYIRLYDLPTKSMVYEQEIYNQFTYNTDRSFFHSFPGDKFMVGLNFAEEEEATKFNLAVEAKLHEREKRATIKRSKDGSTSNAMPISRAPVNTVDSSMDPFSGSTKKSKPKKPKGKLSKSDISAPSDFRHLSHVGFDPSTGAFDSSNISPEWKQLLDHVGVTNEQLKNKDTATFIYDFVEKHGGIEEANRQLLEASNRTAPPPPPPSRKTGGGRDRELPAPPSSRNRGAPPPPPSSRGGPPPPPPAGVPAPPPPPPPPPMGGPAAPAPPSIRAGVGGGPPPPPPSRDRPNPNLPTVSDDRGNLLASIRKGTQLKKVPDETSQGPSPPASSGGDGIGGALVRALAQRNNVFQQSDSEEDEDWAAEDDEDEWSD